MKPLQRVPSNGEVQKHHGWGRDVSSLGFVVRSVERLDWLGGSPDGLLGSFPGGEILEVYFQKGKPETGVPLYYVILLHASSSGPDGDNEQRPDGSTIFLLINWLLFQAFICVILY